MRPTKKYHTHRNKTKKQKKMKKTTKFRKSFNQSKKQRGGILLKMPAKEAFDFFVNNSRVELLTDQSSFGVILKLSLKSGVDSPYEMFSASKHKEPVKALLVKLVALGPKGGYEEWEYLNGKIKRIDLEETFEKEVNIQTDIFFKTMEYLEPLCPAPVYSNIMKNNVEARNFLRMLDTKAVDNRSKIILQHIQDSVKTGEIPWLGVLGMEIALQYMPLFEYYNRCIKENDLYYYEWCEQMAKLQILDLAVKTGYSQNDFHRGNLLINPNYEGMYKGLAGKVLIIDFGLASKIDINDLKKIKDFYNEKKFQEALSVFKSFTRSDGLSISEYPAYYGWLYNEDTETSSAIPERANEYYDAILGKLFLKEEQAIDDRIQLYDKKHQQKPDLYPLLPLSNAIKNKFFQGMIGGKNKKQENKKTRNTL
jgi:hypothetical protein